MDQKLVRQLSTLAFTDAAQNVVLIPAVLLTREFSPDVGGWGP